MPDYPPPVVTGQQKCYWLCCYTLQDATNGYCQVGVYGTELGCCPTDGSDRAEQLLHLTSTGAATPGHRKSSPAAGGKDKLNATEDSGYPATYYAVVDYAHKVPSPANSTGWFCPPSARCGMFIKTALLCLKARQWYQA